MNSRCWVCSQQRAVSNHSHLILSSQLRSKSSPWIQASRALATDLTAQQQIKLLNIENFTKKMKDLTEHLRVEMLIAQAIYEFSVNRSCRPCPHYFIGDKVWLNAKNLNTARPAVKLDNRHVRSFKVKRVFEKNSLVIKLKLSRIHEGSFCVSCHPSEPCGYWPSP